MNGNNIEGQIEGEKKSQAEVRRRKVIARSCMQRIMIIKTDFKRKMSHWSSS